MILFTQSTAVLHKYLNDELKIFCFFYNFPWGCTEFPENLLSFPCSEKSLSIPGFPHLWPPCKCPSCHQTNSVKALKAWATKTTNTIRITVMQTFTMYHRKQKCTSHIPSRCLDEAAVPRMQRIRPFSVVDQLCFDQPMPGEFQSSRQSQTSHSPH